MLYSSLTGNYLDSGVAAAFPKIIEHILDTNVNVNTTVQETTNTSSTDISNVNETSNVSNTDASVTSSTDVNTETNIDSSQEITNTNITDNTSIMDITSSTDTYNMDSSSTENVNTSTVQSKMIQSCGATIEEAQQAVSLVTDESINTNIDNSNTFVNTGDNVTISDVQMETQLDFVGANVDKSCMLDALNELEGSMEASTENTKDLAGGEGGEISTEAGGNTTSNENTSEKSDQLDATQSTDATQELTADASVEQTTENTVDQSAATEQTGSTNTNAQKAGGIEDIFLIGLVLMVVSYSCLKNTPKINIDFDKIIQVLNDNHLYVVIIVLILANLIIN
tara:strand:+ start:4501 stop:5517 length:1017 start_codon:yes stop_codon:yes gene_type:complete